MRLQRLSETFSKLIPAYAISEYAQIVLNEVKTSDLAAIILEDDVMGAVIGQKVYITGKIKDKSGRVLEYDVNNLLHQNLIQDSFYQNSREIFSNGKKIGKIYLYISDDNLNKELKVIIADTFKNTLFISVLIFIVLFITIEYLVLKPISTILAAIKNVDKEGIPCHKIKEAGPIELKAIAMALNHMITAIRSSRHDLTLQREESDYQANHDGLTGLKNRLFFNLTLEQVLSSAQRHQHKVALLFIDLDRFKEINDSFGHHVGDMVLQIVSKRLHSLVRKDDLLVRLGGDEFVVLLDDIPRKDDLSTLATKIISSIEKEIEIDFQSFYVGASIGISIYPDDGQTPHDLIKNADAAMYRAKSEGRNNFQYYSSEITELAYERVVMEAQIRAGIANNEFIAYFQPQVNGRTGKIIAMEALIRWNSPTLGLVLPDKIIPVADRTNLILELDEFMLKTALTQFSSWYREGLNPGTLSINMTLKELHQQKYIYQLEQLLNEFNFDPSLLEFEITENHVMHDPDKNIALLKKIRMNQIKLAIDDFGTGYSSLSYLKQLPVNKLKIDRSFIKDLPFNSEDASITKAIIALSKSLKYDVIAEGVETQEQVDFLVKHGCEKLQGYHFYQPQPAEKITEILKALDHSSIAQSNI
ncbi:MAG: EAL domain-containing protein [Gammaproteobacteria bacterium]|nr:EAL domain-containing protein [Gammaproteobacteria bacterium]